MGHCFQTVLEVGSLFKNSALSMEVIQSFALVRGGGCMYMIRSMTFLLFLLQKDNFSPYCDVGLQEIGNERICTRIKNLISKLTSAHKGA